MKINNIIRHSFNNSSEITELYRSLKIDYPKFFKMDGLSKLGLLASELILKGTENRFSPREDVAIICFNSVSSLDIDTLYQESIQNKDNYFPSPSLFVYTLPNIVNGEIAIRNKFFGESFFYICKIFDARQVIDTVRKTFHDTTITSVLAAWIEYSEEKKEVFMMWIENDNDVMELTEEQINKLYIDY
ncbi:MAG: hypothetical protein LBI45_06785 [Bacteroidales bacterium]|jgi:3-oxoacyl-[acyl-carrier-protein] synthase-1|nr:hypothetical protein [Bacteroidales bacterium]